MADKPILFTAPMVQGLIREIENHGSGKSQTRRLIKPQPDERADRIGRSMLNGKFMWVDRYDDFSGPVPTRIEVGDRLYVREAYRVSNTKDKTKAADIAPRSLSVMFEAGGSVANWGQHNTGGPTTKVWLPDNSWPASGKMPPWAGKLRPGIFLPRWASRITLIVDDVRIERLQDISEVDAIAEGIVQHGRFYGLPDADWDDAELTAREAYERLWSSINDANSWAANPWIVAYTFHPFLCNIDDMPKEAVSA